MIRGKVLLAAPVHAVLEDGLKEAGFELIELPEINQAIAMEHVGECVGIVTSTRIQVDQKMMDAAPHLAWVARMGSGMEVIDLDYAKSKGIVCISSPEGNANAVAEHALGLLLNITKHISNAAEEVIHGLWLREENRGIELEGRTIGIIGFGHTGRAFAKVLSGMDVKILAYDTHPIPPFPDKVEICDSLERIWNEAEIVSFHVPISAETFHYFDADFLGKMKQPFILLNTSRGTVVDTHILLGALESGKVLGLGLDVWEEEPLSKMSPEIHGLLKKIAGNPGVIITPHIAGYTFEALYKMSKVLLMKVLRETI
ncbi:MAG: NAD(P)-dependent oxidoreductase [Chitinophagaceae bacterium]